MWSMLLVPLLSLPFLPNLIPMLPLPRAIARPLRYYCAATVYLSTMGLVGSAATFVSLVLNAIGQGYMTNYYVARIFYIVASRVMGVKVRVEGAEYLERDDIDSAGRMKADQTGVTTGPAIVMNNHQSMLDILVVGKTFPRQTTMISKQSIMFTPLGPFMLLAGCIFIDRANPTAARKSLHEGVQTMKRHRLGVWIFPEGTRHQSPTPSMLPLKKGGFHTAVEAQIPIIPVVTENYWWAYRQGVWGFGEDGPNELRVKVLPPIPTAGLTIDDIPELVTRVRDQMLVALREISRDGPAPSADDKTAQLSVGPVPEKSPLPSPPPEEAPKPVEGVPKPVVPLPTTVVAAEGVSGERRPVPLAHARDNSSAESAPSESGSNGTEEDEGMVLVGRPE
ncbi:hypothetical protein EV121DRAFT_265608 [Schizophyllum commune]